MAIQQSKAEWKGSLKEGRGVFTLPNAQLEAPYTFVSRFEDGTESNPEELAGAALASCFSMFVSALISKQELTPERIHTTASVDLGKDDNGPKILSISLQTEVRVAGLAEDAFQDVIETAKNNCPISKLFTGAPIEVSATLENA